MHTLLSLQNKATNAECSLRPGFVCRDLSLPLIDSSQRSPATQKSDQIYASVGVPSFHMSGFQ